VVEEVLAMRFDSPGTILYGAGSRHQLAEILQANRVLIVSDGWLVQSGAVAPIVESLSRATCVFDGVQADPTEANVEAGLAALIGFEADGIVAFGGGSSIDCAKAIRFRAGDLPLVAVPTTAGTGSEATPVMVITDTAAGVKRMTRDARLMPDVAIVDYELSMSMPRGLTAHVGVDTLTHGIEAYVSRKRHALTTGLAHNCIERCVRYLRRAWVDGGDREAREAMALAAFEGGLAFGNASVALVHGMSRPLGALFHIPHGLSNAVLLPEVTRFSFNGAEELYAEIAAVFGVDRSKTAFIEWLENLNRDLEVPRLRECCGNDFERFQASISKMAVDALASGSPGNNPVVPTAAEIEEIYLAAW